MISRETNGPTWRIHHRDCLDVMREMDAGSVDAVVTDPPYGLEFMGKEWDGADGFRRSLNANDAGRDSQFGRLSRRGPEYRAGHLFQKWCETWAAAMLRVATPGAHLLAFGGTRTFHRLTCALEDAGWEIRDCLSWLYGSGFPKSHNGEWGGTALKPAWEPVVVARKPLIGTVAANHAKHGVGGLNIDGCRIGVEARSYTPKGIAPGQNNAVGVAWDGGAQESVDVEGRWPANVCLDEEAARLLDEQSGESKGGGYILDTKHASIGYGGDDGSRTFPGIDDFGGASRFFYCAKASRGEREAGLNGVEREQVGDGRAVPADNAYQRGATMRANTHPTVKPVDLMRWLVRLVAPVGSTVLDPFMGSGTTGVSCIEEGCHFIGIEHEAAYVEIATRRLVAAQSQGRLDFTGGVK